MGFKVGMFISPHISTFRERITINGELSSMENIVETCHKVFKIVEDHDLDVRFFEIVTIIGFLEFQRHKCDYVVLECGLGGALDATNIIERPELIMTAITSIGLDHQDVLGETKEEISAEKAGIIKAGVPCVVGPTCDLYPITDRANLMKIELTRVPKHETFTKDNMEIAQ